MKFQKVLMPKQKILKCKFTLKKGLDLQKNKIKGY